MQGMYFVREDVPPEHLDTRYSWVLMPWRTLWKPDWTDAAMDYRAAGLKVMVHTPFCYHNPTFTGSVHETYRALLDDLGGWLMAPDGSKVGPVGDDKWRLIDPRDHKVRRQLINMHVGLVESCPFVPDGLFLDFLWDRVAWYSSGDYRPFASLSPTEWQELDLSYKNGLYSYATGLKFRLRQGDYEGLVYGNGWHRCTVLDGINYEHWPYAKNEGGQRGLHISLDGYYGMATWRMFDSPPMLMVTGNEHAHNVVAAIAFAAKWCQEAIIVDNSEYVLDLMEY